MGVPLVRAIAFIVGLAWKKRSVTSMVEHLPQAKALLEEFFPKWALAVGGGSA
jgi:hypothetical protein